MVKTVRLGVDGFYPFFCQRCLAEFSVEPSPENNTIDVDGECEWDD